MGDWLIDPRRPRFVGVVHLAPGPGSPGFGGDLDGVLERAREDARVLVAGGVDSLIVENFGDAPFFPENVPPETTAFLGRAVESIATVASGTPIGVNVLRNDARAALGLCAATNASFLRINVHVGAMVTDQGLIQGRAAETLRERARLCPSARILADVHVKHAAPLVPRAIGEAAAETAQRGMADALIVSGTRTGAAPDAAELQEVREHAPGVPLLVGSGFGFDNAEELLAHCDGAIVGTALKEGGDVHAPVDAKRVARMREALGRS